MTAYRRPYDSSPTDESCRSQEGECDGAPLRSLPTHDPLGTNGHADAEAASEGTHYLGLALASRRAAGLPDEIADYEPWRALSRAISRDDPLLGTPRTSGVDTRCGFHDVQRRSVAAAGPVAESGALPATSPQDHPPR